MAYENNDKKMESVYSARIRAGKRRTYFFDVRATKGNDYYLTITESRKRFNEDGYDRHKLFLYKEDFNKFIKGLTEAVEYVKTDLMPDFDFDAFNHEGSPEGGYDGGPVENRAADDTAEGMNTSAENSVEEVNAIKDQPLQPEPSPQPDDSTNHKDEQVDKW
ncbi:MAG: DUF3276 family protein [Ginsengibacter sp.]